MDRRLKLFQETNKTGFKEDGTYRGILSVTSGLDLPEKPLKSISTSEMIYTRQGLPCAYFMKSSFSGQLIMWFL